MTGLDHGWLEFSAVAAAELLLFVLLVRYRRASLAEAMRALLFGLPAGLLLGLAMDLFLGRLQNVFAYHLQLDLRFLALNGLLGYGPAMATAWLFPVALGELPPGGRRGPAFVAGAGSLLLLVVVTLADLPQLARAFSLGATILLLGETTCAAFGRAGPLLQVAHGRLAPMARLWLYSALVGALYELLNWALPVWQWRILGPGSEALQETLLIALGYVVLFHPLVVVSRLALGPQAKRDRTAPSKSGPAG